MATSRTSGMMLGTLSSDETNTLAIVPKDRYADVAAESMAWQGISHRASDNIGMSLLSGFSSNSSVRKITPDEAERLTEILGLMGGIGEQLSVAWTAQQDIQRLVQTEDTRDPEHQVIAIRALAELSGHFLLGASHSLGNLCLRVLMLNAAAAMSITSKRKRSFPPNSEDRNDWLTLNKSLLTDLGTAVAAGLNASMSDMVAALDALYTSAEFERLDNRRGMDYHRRRPQSLANSAPMDGITTKSDQGSSVAIGIPRTESRADASEVTSIITDMQVTLAGSMLTISNLIGRALRAELISFDADEEWSKTRIDILDHIRRQDETAAGE